MKDEGIEGYRPIPLIDWIPNAKQSNTSLYRLVIILEWIVHVVLSPGSWMKKIMAATCAWWHVSFMALGSEALYLVPLEDNPYRGSCARAVPMPASLDLLFPFPTLLAGRDFATPGIGLSATHENLSCPSQLLVQVYSVHPYLLRCVHTLETGPMSSVDQQK